METKPLIYEKIANILKNVESIQKSKKNSSQGYAYRGIDDVFNSLHNLFAESQVFILQDVLEQTTETIESDKKIVFVTKMKIKFCFVTTDGSSVCSTTYAYSNDYSDKGSGKCLSYGLKYVLMQMFLIPTNDVADNDADNIAIQLKSQKANVTNTKNSETVSDKLLFEIKTKIENAKTADELKTIYNNDIKPNNLLTVFEKQLKEKKEALSQ